MRTLVLLVLAGIVGVTAIGQEDEVPAMICELVHEDLAQVAEEYRSELDEGGVAEVESELIPDLAVLFGDAAFDGGRAYMYLFLTDAPLEAAWNAVSDHERHDEYPGSPLADVVALGEEGVEVSYRTDTDTLIGMRSQYTISTYHEDANVVWWRANPEEENSVEHSNGFWAVQAYDDERVLVALYVHLSIGWLKDKWAESVQQRLAESVKAELAYSGGQSGGSDE